MCSSVAILDTPPLIDSATETTAEQANVAAYRTAVEAVAAIAYLINQQTAGGDTDSVWSELAADLSDNGDIDVSAGTEIDYTYIDYNLKLGKKVMIDVALGLSEFGPGAGADGTMTRVAYIHNLSKKTRLTAGYRSSAIDAPGFDKAETVMAFGLRKKF